MSASPISAPRAPRGGALDALRFVAAMFIVVFHFGDEAPVALQSMHAFLGRGYLATDFFLMLSGFVLAKAYGDATVSGKVSLGRFWMKRFVRCYPTHLITLAALVGMVCVGLAMGVQFSEPHRYDLSGLPAQILLLHAFGLGAGQWNMPSWTISALLICYAFFPMLWRGMQRLGGPAAALTLGLVILLTTDLLSLRMLGVEQFAIGFQWTFFRAAPLFLVGMTLARAVQTANWTGAQARTLGLAGGAVLLANAVLAGPDMISILAICAKVSFSLFMVHTLTGAAWFDGVESLLARVHPAVETVSWEAWVMWAGALSFTVAVAAAYCRFVDEPIVGALNRRLFSRKPAVSGRPDPHPAPEPSA